jgi:adenosylcobyric acid synthase
MWCYPPKDRARIKAFGINKFRGDTTLFDEGLTAIMDHTGWTSLGVIPWFADAWKLPAEDVMDVASRTGGAFKIAVPRLGRIANFDDLDPLSSEPDITVEIIEAGRPLPADAQLVLIPGSKSTIADLAHFKRQGWDIDLQAHVRRGGHVLGICGGYQMLGSKIHDPDGIEGPACSVDGLGLLDVETVMHPQKRLSLSSAFHTASGHPVEGYEIHLGKTTGKDCDASWLTLDGRSEGAASANGRIKGCYLHGLFAADKFRAAYLAELGGTSRQLDYQGDVEATLDALADHLEKHMDIDTLLACAADIRGPTA